MLYFVSTLTSNGVNDQSCRKSLSSEYTELFTYTIPIRAKEEILIYFQAKPNQTRPRPGWRTPPVRTRNPGPKAGTE
jgi:hypothetical protein